MWTPFPGRVRPPLSRQARLSSGATSPVREVPREWAAHPYVIGNQWRWQQARYVTAAGALVVVTSARPGHLKGRDRSITALGDPGQVAALVAAAGAEMLAGSLPQSVSMPPGAWDRLPLVLRRRWNLPRRGRWDWMWTEASPPAQTGEHRMVHLPLAEHAEAIRALQQVAIPDTYFTPERPESRWFGIRDHDGALVSVAGSLDWVNAVHLGGIGTHPRTRGQGLGSALTAAVTRAGLDRFGIVSLGVMADNHRAKALYARLGYAVGNETESHHAPRE